MRPLPAREPDLDRRWVTRVAPDPHVRFDTNDYSLDPNLVGRRVEVCVTQREIIAVALDTGELACRHERCFAKNKTITALEHARTLRERPIDRLLEEREVMRPLPAHEPDLDRRWVTRVPPDPHVRFDTNDYSLDPHLVGRRVEVRVSQREVMAVALDTGELAARRATPGRARAR